MRSMPTSVHFATSHSSRSPFGGATATVRVGSGRGTDVDLAGRLESRSPTTHGPPPPGAVGDRDRLTVPETEHAAAGGAARSAAEHGAATSETSTWAADPRSEASILVATGTPT